MSISGAVHTWGVVTANTLTWASLSCALGLLGQRDLINRRIMRRWCAGICDGLGLVRELRGAHLLETTPQAVLVANHQSLMDIIVIGSYLRRDHRWLAKSSLFHVPLMGWHLRLAGHVPVHRGTKRERNRDVQGRVQAVVEEGASLLFFPEGTRSRDGQLQPFKRGAFVAAVATGLPVLPIVVRGTGDLMRRGSLDLSSWGARRCEVTVLPPHRPPEAGTPAERADALRERTHDAMRAALAESDSV